MKRYFIGIDISKKWLDYAVWDKKSSKVIDYGKFDNKSETIIKTLKKLVKRFDKDELWVCFEHTGNYGLVLSCSLEELSLDYSVVPALEIIKSQGMKRGKNDKIDAMRIAEFACVHSHKLKSNKLPSESFLKIKQLLTYREQLVKTRSAFKNSLKSHQMMEGLTKLNNISSDIKSQITRLDDQIKQVEKELNEIMTKDQDIKKNLDLVKSVKGIGPIVAAAIILSTQNFTSFENPRKFNCYTGLAPFEHSSGMFKGKTKTSKLRNKYMKALMMNAANSAAQYDPQLKQYYRRKMDQGKKNCTVLNAVACKLVYRVFATVKRQSPYIILQN